MWLQVVFLLFVTRFAKIKSENTYKIVGGDAVEINKAPWTVVYGTRPKEMRAGVHCAGAILAPRWVITAAHCEEQPVVIYKTTNLDRKDGDVIAVKSYYPHENYNSATRDWDLQLLKLKKNMQFDDNAQPIRIGDASLIKDGALMRLAGWGKQDGWDTTDGDGNSYTLMSVDLPITIERYCREVLNRKAIRITDSNFCARHGTGGKDTCGSNGGGPATIDNQLVGVVSWRPECSYPRSPSVYSNVTLAKDWISRVMERQGSFPDETRREYRGRRCICDKEEIDKKRNKKDKKCARITKKKHKKDK